MKIVYKFKLSDILFGVIGKAINDAEQVTVGTAGKTKVKITLNSGKDDSLPQGKQTDFTNCETWEAQNYALNILKGDWVLALGVLNHYATSKGEQRTTFNCKWFNIMKLINGGSALEQFAEAAQAAGVPVEMAGEMQEVSGDDLPFKLTGRKVVIIWVMHKELSGQKKK